MHTDLINNNEKNRNKTLSQFWEIALFVGIRVAYTTAISNHCEVIGIRKSA